jgi:hypothetical protein
MGPWIWGPVEITQGPIRPILLCQLRRLGARGGAGKPTLLSLKN